MWFAQPSSLSRALPNGTDVHIFPQLSTDRSHWCCESVLLSASMPPSWIIQHHSFDLPLLLLPLIFPAIIMFFNAYFLQFLIMFYFHILFLGNPAIKIKYQQCIFTKTLILTLHPGTFIKISSIHIINSTIYVLHLSMW